MAISSKEWLACILNEKGLSYYVDANGVVKTSSTPKPLKHMPNEWQNIELNFGRSSKYLGLERNFTSVYKFVKDGAKIIRNAIYNKTGIEEKLFFCLLKWNYLNGLYEVYYKSEIDLLQIGDVPNIGADVSMIEGGAAKLIKANESTIYEIPCDELIVNIQGVTFLDKFNYYIPEHGSGTADRYACAATFINNEGDNINIIQGYQQAEDIEDANYANYLLTSPNYLIKTFNDTTLTVSGSIRARGDNDLLQIYFAKTDDTRYYVFNDVVIGTIDETREFNFTIPLDNGEALFLFHDGDFVGRIGQQGNFSIKFESRANDTRTFALRPLTLFTRLIEKITGATFLADSSLLEEYKNLVVTSGDCLRGIVGGVIKTSLTDFYESFGRKLGGALGVRFSDNKVIFEKRNYFFDNTNEIADLGEVSDLEISVAKDFVFNKIKVGEPSKKEDEGRAKQAFNATQYYTTSITRVNKELDLVSKYVSDCYTIEKVRKDYLEKNETDGSNDNSVFILHITGEEISNYLTARNDFIVVEAVDADEIIPYLFVSLYSFTVDPTNSIFTPTQTFDGTAKLSFQVTDINTNPGNITIELQVDGFAADSIVNPPLNTPIDLVSLGTLTPANNLRMVVKADAGALVMTIEDIELTFVPDNNNLQVYDLLRESYSLIEGVTNPTTIYNIEDLTPKRTLYHNGDLISGAFYKNPTDQIVFTSADKNAELITTLNGVTISEKNSPTIDTFASSWFRPFMFSFKTKVPTNIINLLQQAGKGYIKFTWNGVELYGFPWEVGIKPIYDEAQEWKLLCSSLTDPAIFETINTQFLSIENKGMISHKLPIKLIRVGANYPLQYHFKQMDTDWFSERVQNYAGGRKYFQKWQTNDNFQLQFITEGLSIDVKIIDCNQSVIDTITMTPVVDPVIINPMQCFQGTVDCSVMTAGKVYYILATFGTGGTAKEFISEPMLLANDWENTLLVESSNDTNQKDIVWSSGFTTKIRVEGNIQKFKPDSKFTNYEDQPLNVTFIDGQANRGYELFIGGEQGTPDWLIDKINRMLLLDNVNIDGYAYQISEGAKLEPTEILGSPLNFWAINIVEANNKLGIAIDADGENESELTVMYNINTKGFSSEASPNADQTDNIVQITEIE